MTIDCAGDPISTVSTPYAKCGDTASYSCSDSVTPGVYPDNLSNNVRYSSSSSSDADCQSGTNFYAWSSNMALCSETSCTEAGCVNGLSDGPSCGYYTTTCGDGMAPTASPDDGTSDGARTVVSGALSVTLFSTLASVFLMV